MRSRIATIALVAALTFQLITGVTTGGKPDKPSDETGTFLITIGINEDDDIKCDRTFEVTTSGGWLRGWYPDAELKGKAPQDYLVWTIPIEDRYGPYVMNPVSSPNHDSVLTDFHDPDQLVQFNRIAHVWKPGEYDYWLIAFNWISPIDLDDDGTIGEERLYLNGDTNRDSYVEGDFDSVTNTWTVDFNNEYFRLFWDETVCEEIGHSGKSRCGRVIHDNVWDGFLTVHIEIQRTG